MFFDGRHCVSGPLSLWVVPSQIRRPPYKANYRTSLILVILVISFCFINEDSTLNYEGNMFKKEGNMFKKEGNMFKKEGKNKDSNIRNR